jgi:hypothetical protein
MSNYERQAVAADALMREHNRRVHVAAERIGARLETLFDETIVDLPEGWTMEMFMAEVEAA